MMLNVATILVTWNQTAMTLDCIAALLRAGVHAETIWVVDNGSQPDATPEINARFAQVHVVRLAENTGFTGGNNAGVAAALAAGAQSVFLLNNDAFVEPTTIPALWAALEADPQLAAVGPRIYFDDKPRVFQSVGVRVQNTTGRVWLLGAHEVDHGQYEQSADRDALSGCALLVRRAAWEQIGPLWEPFFAYAEEVDWCLRAGAAGWRMRYVPEAAVWHRTGGTLGAAAPLRVYFLTRNQYYLRARHAHGNRRAVATALYWSGRTWARYLRLRQRPQARAVRLGLWDYARGRTGNPRTPDLRLRKRGQ